MISKLPMPKGAVAFTVFKSRFFKYCHCNGNKIHYLKTIDFDKQPLALTVYSIDLELEGFETPEESRFLEQY